MLHALQPNIQRQDLSESPSNHCEFMVIGRSSLMPAPPVRERRSSAAESTGLPRSRPKATFDDPTAQMSPTLYPPPLSSLPFFFSHEPVSVASQQASPDREREREREEKKKKKNSRSPHTKSKPKPSARTPPWRRRRRRMRRGWSPRTWSGG